jgi:hypothetical protein
MKNPDGSPGYRKEWGALGKTKLTQQQLDAIRMRLFEGKTLREISEALGVPHSTVRSWFYENSKIKAEIEEIRAETIDRAYDALVNAAHDAASKIVQMVRGQWDKKQNGGISARSQLDACKDLLDRVGLKPVERQEIKQEITNVEYVAEWGDAPAPAADMDDEESE